ncbi:nucleotide disphospho-sugar-binding domain-containing protein [Streptomyces sp. CB02613]|uniref:nucleotide disphospho-sugar-binding domain-containing protein n=1 Tax=Streptomyces sp. CB02613 TaxID=2020328 RepID=UPI001F1E578C|nr:nucleotide disphospho-sugar-binding domain-containing protein [Streptomyces sp. CB02613]
MRVMLMSFPTRTHIYSLAPVGWALRAAGHEVRYVGQRNPSEIDPFLQTGLESAWVGGDFDIAKHRQYGDDGESGASGQVNDPFKLAESRPERLTDEYVRAAYETTAGMIRYVNSDEFLNEALRYARRWQPDLIVWDPLIYAGAMVAEVVGAAQMRMLYAADQNARVHFEYEKLKERRPEAAWPDPLAEWMAEWLGRHGCAFHEELRFGSASICPSPSCVRFPLDVNYLPVRFVPVNRPLPMPDWALEAPTRPRVLLTLGVSNRQVHGVEQASVSELLAGLGRLDVEVIATFNKDQLASVRNVPDNVRAEAFVPMNEVLASCSAIVHQGGGATVGNAVVNGVPQLIVPGTIWSERASAVAQEKRGYGLFIDLEDITAERVRDKVARLVEEPSFRENARQVQAEMLATRTLGDLVPELEAAAARRRQRSAATI